MPHLIALKLHTVEQQALCTDCGVLLEAPNLRRNAKLHCQYYRHHVIFLETYTPNPPHAKEDPIAIEIPI